MVVGVSLRGIGGRKVSKPISITTWLVGIPRRVLGLDRGYPQDVPHQNLICIAMREEPRLAEGYGPRHR